MKIEAKCKRGLRFLPAAINGVQAERFQELLNRQCDIYCKFGCRANTQRGAKEVIDRVHGDSNSQR